MKREKVRIIGYLNRKERRDFKKDNAGYKLAFRDRFPNFPIYFSIFVLLIVLLKTFLLDMPR